MFGVVVTLIKRPAFNMTSFLLAMVAGAAWVVGQCGQYYSYSKIGVSETMPLSTGLQLIGVPLVGVLIFGEWPTAHAKVIGFIALALVVIGIVLSSNSDDKGSGDANAKNIAFLLITTIVSGFIQVFQS